MEVWFNNKKLTTPNKEGVQYAEFNELFHSTLIKNDTQYTIRFMDHKKVFEHKLMATETSKVHHLTSRHQRIFDNWNVALYYLGYWTDQFTDGK